jgi:hypothetical protein
MWWREVILVNDASSPDAGDDVESTEQRYGACSLLEERHARPVGMHSIARSKAAVGSTMHAASAAAPKSEESKQLPSVLAGRSSSWLLVTASLLLAGCLVVVGGALCAAWCPSSSVRSSSLLLLAALFQPPAKPAGTRATRGAAEARGRSRHDAQPRNHSKPLLYSVVLATTTVRKLAEADEVKKRVAHVASSDLITSIVADRPPCLSPRRLLPPGRV